ncbi:hypothetical protein TNCV_1285121 [Trichonephila clavipes]|uniref:Uncharacterized protein n=1 Tax=Trichonephila clavipes TaxID=2585209 RepID=A0A8X6SV23_TRICX|nr:hypothetical protein TNCV_1285121 [Trichonephila clavipes]
MSYERATEVVKNGIGKYINAIVSADPSPPHQLALSFTLELTPSPRNNLSKLAGVRLNHDKFNVHQPSIRRIFSDSRLELMTHQPRVRNHNHLDMLA